MNRAPIGDDVWFNAVPLSISDVHKVGTEPSDFVFA